MSQGGGASGGPKKGLTLDDLIAAIDRHERNPSNIPKVEQRQVRLQRQKRKEKDATASGTPGVTRIVTYVLAQLGYATEPVVQRRVVTVVQVKGTEPVIEQAVQEELWEEEESVPQRLTKAQRKVRNLAQGGQGSGKAQAPQALTATPLNVADPSSSTGPSQGGAPSYGQWPWPVINAIVPWGSPPPVAGPQTSMPPPIYPAAQAQPVAPPPSPAPSSQKSVAGGGNQGQGNQGNGGRGGGRGRGRNGGGRGRQWNGQGQGYQGQGSQGQGYQGQGYQGQGNQGQGYQGQGYQGQGYQGQGDQGSQGYGRPRFDWRTTICQHCDQQGHTIRFCNIRREDERSGLISSTIDGNIYDQFGEAIDRRLGGVRAEAQRRAAAGPPPPAMFRLWQERKGPSVGIEKFRLWQEKEEPPIGVEEVGSDEEVTQEPRGGSKGEEFIIIDSDDENEEERMEPSSVLLGKIEDLLDKMGRYQQKLVDLFEEVRKWKSNIPKVFLYDSGPESAPGRPRVNVGGGSESGAAGKEKGARGEVEPVMRDGPPKRKKYPVRLEEGFVVEKVIDRLLEGHNDLMTMKEILASAPRLRDELKGRLSWRLVPNVHLGTILPKKAELAESGTKMDWKCVACGTVDLVVKGSKCAAMVDIGAEMNIIREVDAIRFGLDIDRSDCSILHGASCKAVFCGTISNVLIEVGKVKAWACFFIIPDVDHGILLGRKLVCQDQEWVWGEEQEEVVARMKEEFREGGLVLGAPDYDATETRPFIVETDAGPTTLGGVLIEADIEGKERPLRFESRTLCTTERNYSQFKRETIVVLHCLRILRNYIFGRRFILRVDPTALAYSLRNYVPSDPTVARWLTYIWMFNFELERIPDTLASSHSLVEDMRTIEEGPGQGERHEDLMGGMYLLVNTLLQESLDQSGSLNPAGNVDEVSESQDDEFEEGEIKEAFRAEEYDGIYLELGLLLSCEMRLRDASDRAQRMLQRYLVRDDHLFVRREVGNPRRVVCGRNRQIDVVAALYDGITEGHRGVQATYAKISELYYSDGMMDMFGKFCRSCPGEEEPETDPEAEERGAYPECGLGPMEFHRFTEGGLRRSPARTQEEPSASEGPLRELETHLDISRWRASPRGEEHGEQAEEVPREEVPQEEVSREEVPQEEVPREEVPREEVHLAAYALEHPDLEEPAPAAPRQEPCQPEKEMKAEIPKRVDLRTRERAPAGGTAEEKRARKTRRIDEIWQERQRLDAAGELPEQQQERQRSEAAGALPGQPPSTSARAPEIPEMWRDFWEQRGEELPSPVRAGFGVARKTEERLDRKIKFLAKTTFDRHLLLEGDLAGKKRKEASHGVEREAFEFRGPIELATLPVAAAGPVVPLAVEEGRPPSSSEPAQGSTEGSMGVLLVAVHTMQEEVSLFSPEQRIEEPLEREMGIEAEGAIEGGLQRLGTPEYGPEEIEEQPMAVPGETLERRPQRLNTPKYVPATEDLRSRLGSWATESWSGGPVPGIEQQEVVSVAAPRPEQQGVVSTLLGSPSSPPPQPKKKKFKRKVDQLCFYCKRGMHLTLNCFEFLEDKAEGKVLEAGGKMYDRQGRIVEKSGDGLRAQLYRQNQEVLRR
ncbi:hypothetical protein CBR_g31269 [Chara braunii]|uniref:Uncharacterized protein n=1 Tax=Chara braunii TaxID=69332 RepID=A0A388JXT5_CHABU|nr:hypothetical protein CBR_g31269 [Chara braunii]|eukprot:GBG62634.1 hypothetical protein CBR_g31269 [Chara braunii]